MHCDGRGHGKVLHGGRVRPGRRLALCKRPRARHRAAPICKRVPLYLGDRRLGARPSEARANSPACHSTSLDARVDLPSSGGPYPGDRSRRERAQAIPLSRALARGARRDEVWPACGFCPRPAAHSPARRTRSCAAWTAAREGDRHDRALARDDVRAHRQCRVRPRQRILRSYDVARATGAGPRRDTSAALQGKERRAARSHFCRPAHRADRAPHARPAGRRTVPVPGRAWPPARDRVRRRQRVPEGGRRSRLHEQGFPHMGRHPALPASIATPARAGVRGERPARGRSGRASGRLRATQYACSVPPVLYPPGRHRRLRGRAPPASGARAFGRCGAAVFD